MNDDLSPLEPDELDELLSAELDNEFEAAARDLGMTVGAATARIRATPGSDARRSVLAQARDLLSEPPDIDELVDARLRAKAVRAARADRANRDDERKGRRNRALLGASGLAAAIVVALAIAAGLSTHHSGSKASPAGKSDVALSPVSTTAPKPFRGPTKSLGAFTNAHSLALGALLQGEVYQRNNDLSGQKSPTGPETTNGPATHDSTTPTPRRAAAVPALSGAGTTTDRLSTPTAESGAQFQFNAVARSCQPGPWMHAGDTLILRATATLSGQPVVVFVFTQDAKHIVMIRDRNCTLLTMQTLP
jgi:hypothetical protein